MKRVVLVVLTSTAVLLTIIPAVDAAKQAVPTGAYVRKPVSSVEELAAHINRDPVVRERFAKHFGVSTPQLSEYIRDNVVITKVSSATPSRVYIVTRGGQMVSEKKVLRKDTPIFALKDTGQPLLVLSCGNPMLKTLPPRVKVKAEVPQVYQAVRPNETSAPPPVIVAELPPVQASPPPVPAVTPAVPPAVIPPNAVPPVLTRGRPNLLPLLPLAGLINTGGGNGNKPPDPPPPVPEPAGAAAVIATALLPAAGWGIRRVRTRQSKAVTSGGSDQ